MSEVKKLVFNVPSKDTPGFARRMRRSLALRRLVMDNPSAEVIDELVEFLADYVEAENRQTAVDLVWDASETQWFTLLDALGGASNAQVPPMKSETSEKA